MKYAFLAIAVMEFSTLSCKQRRTDSGVQSETDIEDSGMKWVSSEGKWAIRCRDGKLHRGFKSALVRSDELKTACEDVDPNWPPQGGGTIPNPGGGGVVTPPGPGGLWGGEISLELCNNLTPPRPVDPRVAKLDVALSPDLQEEIRAINPANLRSTRLCGGVAGQLMQLVANDDTFKLFTGNGDPNKVITLLVGRVGTDVKFIAEDPSLSLPWQIDNDVVSKINNAIAATGTNLLCGTSSKYVFEKCWVMGEPGKSCQQVCQSRSKQYSAFTTSIAGTYGGTDANCKAVCQAFGISQFATANPTGGFDCFTEGSVCKRDGDQDGNSETSASSNYARICVCQ